MHLEGKPREQPDFHRLIWKTGDSDFSGGDPSDLGTASADKEVGRFSRLFIWKITTWLGCN